VFEASLKKVCRRDQGKEVTLLPELWTRERTIVLAQHVSAWMQCSYHIKAASLPPPIAAESKAGRCVLEFLFSSVQKNISSTLPVVQKKYCDTTERIVGTKNKDKRSETETKEGVLDGSWSNGVMF